jgi:hypothetical protein
LEAQLEPGEELLAYTGGAITGIVSTRPIYLGLTAERLILLSLKRGRPTGQIWNIWRENIVSLEWSGLWDRLKIRLPKDRLDIACGKRYWKKRARNLIESHLETPVPRHDAEIMMQRTLEQIEVFHELDLIASVEAMSEDVRRANPEIELAVSSPEVLAEKRLALRVGAAFLFINAGIAVLFGALIVMGDGSLEPGLFVSIIIDLVIGINLWKGNARQWSNWAIIRAALGLIFYGIISLVGGAYLDFVAQAALCGSIILVLAGESKRGKTLASIGIYAIGFLGVILLSFVIGFLGGLP